VIFKIQVCFVPRKSIFDLFGQKWPARMVTVKNCLKILNWKKQIKIHQIWTAQSCCIHNSSMKHSKAVIDKTTSELKIEKLRKLESCCRKSIKQWNDGWTKTDKGDRNTFIKIILSRFLNYSKLLKIWILYFCLKYCKYIKMNWIHLAFFAKIWSSSR